ncbi:MAG: ABC transporter substrate-binding protein [Acholeplasmataceae bacterium]
MKKILVFSLAFVLTMSLIACGNGDESGGDPETNIKVLLDSKDRDVLRPLMDDFREEFPEYTLEVVWTPGDDIQTNQGILIGAKNPPDIIIGGSMYTEAYGNILLPLNELIERDAEEVEMDDIFDGIMGTITSSNGDILYMPRFFNVSLLYYNKDLFDNVAEDLVDAGLEDDGNIYPTRDWTIEDFFTAGEILTRTDSEGDYTQWGSTHVRGWWGEWLIHVYQSGGELFDEDGYVNLDTPEAIAGMQVFHDKVFGNDELGRGKISPGPGEPDFGGLEAGKVGMEYGGHTANWARYDSNPDLDWGVELLPTGLEGRTGAEFAVDGIGIHEDSENIEGAWEFLKFLTNPNGIQTHVDLGYVPIRQSVLDDMPAGFKKDRSELAVEAIDYSVPLPTYEYFLDVTTNYIENEISNMLARPSDSSKKSIPEGMEDATESANNYIDLNYR